MTPAGRVRPSTIRIRIVQPAVDRDQICAVVGAQGVPPAGDVRLGQPRQPRPRPPAEKSTVHEDALNGNCDLILGVIDVPLDVREPHDGSAEQGRRVRGSQIAR